MNREERLSKSLFAGLPNVKGTVAEDARITDSPPRSEPVLEIRVRPRRGMLRCSQCGRRRRGHDQGGACVAGAVRTSAAGESSRSPRCPAWAAHGAASWVASVPWAEPGSRFTKDFEAECAWLMTVANQKTVSGFLHVAWRTAVRRRPLGRGTRQGADALAVRRAARDRRGRNQPPQGPHVHHRGRRPRTASGDIGARRVRQGRVRPVLQGVDARTARLHQGRHRRRGPLDRPVRRRALPERRTRIGTASTSSAG